MNSQIEFDVVAWLVIAAFAVYIWIIWRADVAMEEAGVQWHSDNISVNPFETNVLAVVADAEDKVKQKQRDDEDKNDVEKLDH